jgi:hypothetical protein
MADTLGTIAKQQAWLDDSLHTLKTTVLGLPKTLPSGTPDGPIAWYFCNLNYDKDDGPYKAVDCAWTRMFKVELTDTKWEVLVLGGQYGL